MNNKILKQRISSIRFYEKEIGMLKEAVSVTESTKKDIIDSLKEFFPFKDGDIVSNYKRVFKVGNINSVGVSHGGDIYALVNVFYSDRYGNFKESSTEYYYFENDTWKMLISFEEIDQNQQS